VHDEKQIGTEPHNEANKSHTHQQGEEGQNPKYEPTPTKQDQDKPIEESLINWKLIELKHQLQHKIQWLESLKTWYFSC